MLKRTWWLVAALVVLLLMSTSVASANVSDGRIVANIEKIETYGSTLHVVGWAYDTRNPSASVTIDVDSRAAFSANKSRPDVNKSYGISGNHGFDFEYKWTTGGERVMMTVLYSDGTGGCALYDNIAVFPYVYTVSYNANGGSGAPATDYKHCDIALRLSDKIPTRTGYTFKGWAKSSTGSAAYQAKGSYTSNASITLYAVWQKNTYTISFNANGGTGAPANQTGTYGSKVTLSSTVPQYQGRDFLGWATSASGSAAYQPGSSVTVNNNMTLYAVWKLKTYAVSYNANGGSGAPAAQTKTYGTNLTLSTAVPVREDYNFLGWAAAPDAAQPAYQPGDVYIDNAALTLYAVWELARVPGDLNDDRLVDVLDVQLMLYYLAEEPVTIQMNNADVTGDGLINGKDLLRLLKYLDGQDVTLE